MNKGFLFKTTFIMFILCFAALIVSCGSKEEVKITSGNYNNYITITVKLKTLQRADGTKINGSSKLYSDSRMPFVVEVKNKNGVKIQRIDLSVTVSFNVTYYKYSSSLGGNKQYTATMTQNCNGMVFSDIVDSYSYVFQYEKMTACYNNGFTINSISGTVMA